MALLVTSSSDGDSLAKNPGIVPPLFALPLREEMISRIQSALAAGDLDKAATLFREANSAFPGDRIFPALYAEYLKLAHRNAHFEAALQDALNELANAHFTASLARFRESLCLARGFPYLEHRTYDAALDTAYQQLAANWRFAEALLREVASVVSQPAIPEAIWTSIECQKRDDAISVALEESGRAEHIEYLPHLRNRIAFLAKTYPDDELIKSRLRVLDGLLSQRNTDDRDKNFRRLTLFRDRLDLADNPEILQRFPVLVAPFVDPYPADPAFRSVLAEVNELHSNYEKAKQLLSEDHHQEALQICDQVLQQRPANVLFAAIEEKAKAREWVGRLVSSTIQRARTFEEKGQYAEALEEWESLREIDSHHPGLDSEILHCATLKQSSEALHPAQLASVDETALTPEVVDVNSEPVYQQVPSFVTRFELPRSHSVRLRISITTDAWNHLKTGLAATGAVLLVVLVLALNVRH